MRLSLSLLFAGALGLVCAAVLAQPNTGIARAPITLRILDGHPVDEIDYTDYGSDIREINLDGLKKILQRDSNDRRPLLLNFWATWCDPCREEFPDLVKLDGDYKDKGLNFIAISIDDISDIKSEVPKFLNQMKATMPVVLLNMNDPEPAIKLVDATWDGQLPATFLYDKDGRIVFKHFGKIKPDELRAAIDKEIKK
jgi:thiol-disulfide isomerase/thioredoxin